MSYNWNVYKIFNNGKRAKAPIYNFKCDKEEISDDYFDSKIKKILIEKFGFKMNQNNFSVLRSDLSQERKMTENLEEKNNKLRRQVFRKKLDELGIKEKMTEGILLFSPTTNWMWQWCAVQSATTVIRQRITPELHSYEAAQKWMEKEIEKL